MLEAAYQKCLKYELNQRKLVISEEVNLPLHYKGIKLDCGYRIDLWIEKKVIIEIKTVDKLLDLHKAQLLAYLKLTDCKLGYLLNFKSSRMKNGMKRVVNRL